MIDQAKPKGRGGARPGAGRPRKIGPAAPIAAGGGVDPRGVLEAIAGDVAAPATARVAAAKALLDLRKGEPEEKPQAPRELVLFRKAG